MNNTQIILAIALSFLGALWFFNQTDKSSNAGKTETVKSPTDLSNEIQPVKFSEPLVMIENRINRLSRNSRISNGSFLQNSIQKPILRV